VNREQCIVRSFICDTVKLLDVLCSILGFIVQRRQRFSSQRKLRGPDHVTGQLHTNNENDNTNRCALAGCGALYYGNQIHIYL
jgi:hypothetical protein